MLHILYKSLVESTICSAASVGISRIKATDGRDLKKLNKIIKCLLCAGDCSGAPGADNAKDNVTKDAQRKGQHCTPTT